MGKVIEIKKMIKNHDTFLNAIQLKKINASDRASDDQFGHAGMGGAGGFGGHDLDVVLFRVVLNDQTVVAVG